MTGAGQGKDTTTFVFAEMQLLRDLDGEMEEFATEDTGEVMVDVSEKTRAKVIDNLPDDIMPDFSNFGVTDKSQVAGKETGKRGKKKKTYGPVQASSKSSRVDISQPMVDRAVLLKMKQNLELPKSMKGISSKPPFHTIPVDELDGISNSIGVVINEKLVDKGCASVGSEVEKVSVSAGLPRSLNKWGKHPSSRVE